jgi:CAAX protease family protein
VVTEPQPLGAQEPPLAPPAARPNLFTARENPAWSGWDALLLIAVAFVLIVVCEAVGAFIVLALHPNVASPSEQIKALSHSARFLVSVQTIAYVLFFLVLEVYLRARYRISTARAVGWRVPAPRLAALVLGCGVTLALVVEFASNALPIPKGLPIEQLFTDRNAVYLLAVFAVLIAPIFEEVYFRGLLYPVLSRRLGFVSAVSITALCFALIHAEQLRGAWAPLLLLFIVGVVLTVVRAVTRSIVPSLMLHMTYNFALFMLLWLGSDHFRHLERMP